MTVTWLPDPSHYPEQMTPLSATVWFEAIGVGLHEAMRELRGPFGGFRTRTERGWAYELELEPEWEHDAERVRAAALTLGERWERELKPRVDAITAELEAMRPERVDAGGAAALLDRLWELVREQWKLHFLVVVPAQVAAEILHDRYVELLSPDDPLEPYRLLEGLPNESVAADARVRELAALARELDVADVVREQPPLEALERLRATRTGRRFLHELDAYLLAYGGRARWHELSLPREAERPEMTLESVRLYLDGDVPISRQAEERERLERDVLARAPELADTLAAVKAAAPLKETHTYHIDYPGLLATREALVAFGRRLAAEGYLDAADDVWLLTRGELRDALVDDMDVRDAVRRHREDLEAGRAAGPQPFLGDPPADREQHAALAKFYGGGGGVVGTTVTGAAASPGVAEGRARVVHDVADIGRVARGDVLVATTTTPAWTPLFPSVAALVTDTGGILSHAAVVAREYGIPAVVGAAGATRAIRDGARVRVDGNAGVVAILE